uniref:Uncharacterized protein n=1 Tax=Panagrolaimus sp. PS1159 TaxID=55785 RepID=A0AC35FGN9_9BILA
MPPTKIMLRRNNIFAVALISAVLIVVGHYFSILDVNGWFEQIPAWFFILLGVGLTLFVQKKLLYRKVLSESAAASQALELLRNDPTRIAKFKKYTGEKNVPFTGDEFRRWMKLVTEFTIDYYEHPEVYNVTTLEKPGFIYKKMPTEPPFEPEPFDNVMRDMYSIIMPGLTHWQHPRFHAYFAGGQSYPDIVAETLASAIATVNFCWDSAPAFTELEIVMVNWVGKVFNLPKEFLFDGDSETSPGGGSMQNAASDAILLAFLAARHKRITEVCGVIDIHCRDKEHRVLNKLVAYASTEAHSCVEKAALIALVHMRPVQADENFQMRGKDLEKQIQKDVERGNVPFFVLVTLGTTGTGAYDQLKEIIPVAKKYNLWIHIDGSYGGNAWCCEEFRYQTDGLKDVDSININLHKIFLHTSAATFFWARNQRIIKEAMTVDPAYLHARHHGSATDFRNWGIPLSRRAKCLKTWFILRTYGVRGMQEYIRRLTHLTTYFRKKLEQDPRVEIIGQQTFTLVCFRLKVENNNECNEMTKALCEYINHSQKLCITFAQSNGMSICRFSISHQLSLEKETDESYEILSELIDEFLQRSRVPQYSREILFKAGGGVVGSPIFTTQDTLRSTASYASLVPSRGHTPTRGQSPGPGSSSSRK